MKTRLTVLSMLLCLSVVMATTMFISPRVVANDRDTERVTFKDPVMVGSTLLEADTYILEWEGTGPQVQVVFMKGSKTAATVSATLVNEKNHYNGAIQTRTLGDNSRVLEKITWKKKVLIFGQSS